MISYVCVYAWKKAKNIKNRSNVNIKMHIQIHTRLFYRQGLTFESSLFILTKYRIYRCNNLLPRLPFSQYTLGERKGWKHKKSDDLPSSNDIPAGPKHYKRSHMGEQTHLKSQHRRCRFTSHGGLQYAHAAPGNEQGG